MSSPVILPLDRCHDPSIVGGKALGLARLLAAGFPVPGGLCVTTAAYCDVLQTAGLDPAAAWQSAARAIGAQREAMLAEFRAAILGRPLPDQLISLIRQALEALHHPDGQRWAVRSSATNEDDASRGFAGLYRTELGLSIETIPQSILQCWSSLWDTRVIEYHVRAGGEDRTPMMAVVIQPVIAARAAGVAYSIHPVTGRSNEVMVNAVPGLAVELVEGTAPPDQYLLRCDDTSDNVIVLQQEVILKKTALRLQRAGVRSEPLSQDAGSRSSLIDDELMDLARMAKRVERTFRHPVDLEWAIDDRGLWLLQARPVTVIPRREAFTNQECEWSRANFKETMPDVPSPMGLSFLNRFMNAHIIAPYRRLGCHIPEGISAVRVLHGRPYLNVTLFHHLVVQLRGDPSLIAEQMGGEALVRIPDAAPLGWVAFARAGLLMLGELRKAVKRGPAWFAEMKQMAARFQVERLRQWSFEEIIARLDELSRWLDAHELTFGIVGGVAQGLQVMSRLLPGWLGPEWRTLLNSALQGQGTVISAQQILRLAELAQIARRDPVAGPMLTAEAWEPAVVRRRLRGTAFLEAFDRYLEDYGHRGVGESDVMSPHFVDQPEMLLAVVRTQLRSPAGSPPEDIIVRQEATRTEALAKIRSRFGWRLDRWVIFSWWYRHLCLFLALREANRHHLMYYSTATRNLLLRLGELLVARGLLKAPDDIFFLTLEERTDLTTRTERDWRAVVQSRRAEREQHASIPVPDTIREWAPVARGAAVPEPVSFDGLLRGLPISAGHVKGPVRLIRSTADWEYVRAGDILVAPVIDPGMAPLFGIAGGLIVEMGGTLSHGAIIAREYGLPTIANVPHAMTHLRDGVQVELRADSGEVRRVQT
jgi:pyruvate,water dikinase